MAHLVQLPQRRRSRRTGQLPAAAVHSQEERASTAGIPLFLQAQLRVSQPGDAYEQEADRIDSAVVAREAPGRRPGLETGSTPAADTGRAGTGATVHDLQQHAGDRAVVRLLGNGEAVLRRSCSGCGGRCKSAAQGRGACAGCADLGEDELRRMPVPAAEASLGSARGGPLPPSLRSYLARSRGSGRPLDAGVREGLAASFGPGLDAVRVHTGPQAAWAARSVRARAFALGKDIWFGAGEYRPHAPEGQHLLAHEVAHTVEQRAPTSLDSVGIGRADDPAETRADRAAAAVSRREAAPAPGRSGSVIRRRETGEPDRRPAAPTRGACDRPARTRYGRGRARERPSSALRVITDVLGTRAWELYNFDIDKSFVKAEHETYIRDAVVGPLKEAIEDHNALGWVVGEASTTAPQSHNLQLSKRRAACVTEVLERELTAAGVSDPRRVLRPFGFGELPARARGVPDETEHEEDRAVWIVTVRRGERTCTEPDRTRSSHYQLRMKVACESPFSVAINIGDLSDPPIYRRFRWMFMHPTGGCRFLAAESANAMYGLRSDFRLATKDPDNPAARSDFQGEAVLDPGSGWLFGANGFFNLMLEGRWDPETCKATVGEIRGLLMPIGPVECGQVPAPKTGDRCAPEGVECSESDKLAAATEFTALLVRGTVDISDLPGINRLPWDWLPWAPELGGAKVTIGTLDTTGPPLTRVFVFAGAGLDGSGAADLQVGVDKEASSTKPLRLATRDPDRLRSPSDFGHGMFSPAKLVIKGGTNTEELHVGGMVFTFSGAVCNYGSDRTLYGVSGGISPVWCADLSPLTRYEPELNCEVECPLEQQLAGHDTFTFKVGRATLSGLPVIGKRLADAYGCEVVAAYINIGAETEDPGERIYREFVFVGRLAECRFEVAPETWTARFFLARQLSKEDPEDRFDLSDFTGVASLNHAGTLRVAPLAVGRPFFFALPGSYDVSCTGAKGAVGMIVPLDEVRCGDVPDPQDETHPDRTDLDRCRAYADANPFVAVEVAMLRDGRHDRYIDLITHPPGLVYPEIDALPFMVGELIEDARLVGRSGTVGAPKVVTFVDMVVLDYGHDPATGRLWVEVAFTSDPCSFDENGNPVFVRPRDCVETLPHNGLIDRLRRVLAPPEPPPEPEPESDSLEGAII